MATITFANTDCTKVVDPPDNTRITSPPPPPPPPPSTAIALSASSGTDQMVFLPNDYCTIGGWVSGYASFTVLWNKISGPTSFSIELPNSLRTKISNLVNGVYQFEITVSADGLTVRDTCSVIVGQISATPNEVVLSNQVWGQDGLLWGSGIVISNVYQYLPAGRVFRVYIKKDNSTTWEELIMDDYNSWYNFSLLDGNLVIYSNYDETDTPDIKLVY